MTRPRLEPAAIADLQEIGDFIAREDPDAANRVIDRLERAVRALGEFPLIGHVRDDLTALPVRFLSVGSYVVVYEHDSRPVRILRVLHGARDVTTLLRSDRERHDDRVSERVSAWRRAA